MNKKMKPIGVALGALGLIAIGTLSAGAASWASTSTQAPSPTRPPSITAVEAPAAFEAATATFTQALPQGVVWPNALPSNLLEKGVEMEVGIPEAMASFYWLCAWEDLHIRSVDSGDLELATSSLTMVKRFVELPFYKAHFDDPEKVWYQGVVVAAENGDLRGIRDDLAGCAYYFANQK